MVGIPLVRLQFPFLSSLGSLPPFQYDPKNDLACMWDKSNCSVICILFKTDDLSWEVGWTWRTSIPLAITSLPDRHNILCSLSSKLSFLLLWTILLGPHQDLWLCDLLSDGWHEQLLNEVVEALGPNMLVQFFPRHHYGITIPYSPVCDLCSFSQFFSPVTDWIHCRRGRNFRVIYLTIWKRCLEFPFEFAASNSTHMLSSCCCFINSELSLYLSLQFLVTVLIFTFCFSLFPDCCESLIRHQCLLLLRLDGSDHFSGHFQQDYLGTFLGIFYGSLVLCRLQCRKPVGHLCCKCFLFLEFLEIQRQIECQPDFQTHREQFIICAAVCSCICAKIHQARF